MPITALDEYICTSGRRHSRVSELDLDIDGDDESPGKYNDPLPSEGIEGAAVVPCGGGDGISGIGNGFGRLSWNVGILRGRRGARGHAALHMLT